MNKVSGVEELFFRAIGIVGGNLPPRWQAGCKDYTPKTYEKAKLMSKTARFTTPIICAVGLSTLIAKAILDVEIDSTTFNSLAYASPLLALDTGLKEFTLQCRARYFGPYKSEEEVQEILNEPYGCFAWSTKDCSKHPGWYDRNEFFETNTNKNSKEAIQRF